MTHSTKPHSGGKRRSKSKDFPLRRHASGRWFRKVAGQFAYFGKIADDPDGAKALELWLEQKDDLFAGRKPKAAGPRGLKTKHACELYLDHIKGLVLSGRRTNHWYQDLRATLGQFLGVVGKNWNIDSLDKDDFATVAKRFHEGRKGKPASPITVRNRVHRLRGLFKFLAKEGLIQRIPAFGSSFDPPNQEEVDRHRDQKTPRYLSRKEIRKLLRLTKGNPQLYAAILLAINTGAQNEDVATLQLRHLDLKGGWYLQPRTKRAKKRRAKLWERTVRALKAVVRSRQPIGPEDLVFVSKTGGKWNGRNCLAKEFCDFKKAAGITTKGAGFQWLRHSFITHASQTGDLLAVQIACGHAPRSITENYIHAIYDTRLEAIADLVDKWLVGTSKNGGAE